jgi:hypothetical protein
MNREETSLQLEVENVPNYAVRVETCAATLSPSGDVRITGAVVNAGLTRMQAPYLYFTVHDRFGMVLREDTVSAGVKMLQGGEEVEIEINIPDCAQGASFVKVFAST